MQICQKIVWPILKAHDVMSEYEQLSFKNHMLVAIELVKFSVINTSFEAIEKLLNQKRVLEWEDEGSEETSGGSIQVSRLFSQSSR
jgi:hypothetical protein